MFEAAKRLNMSVPELDALPEKNFWINRAMTMIIGENKGREILKKRGLI